MKKIISFFTLLVFFTSIAFGQVDTLAQKNALIKSLSKITRVDSEHIGFAGTTSEGYKTAKSLWDVTSISTLIVLNDDLNPVVRCYAFLGLIVKQADQKTISMILNKHLDDTSPIETMNGCSRWKSNVIVYMKFVSKNN